MKEVASEKEWVLGVLNILMKKEGGVMEILREMKEIRGGKWLGKNLKRFFEVI